MSLSRVTLAAGLAYLALASAADAATFRYAISAGANNGLNDGDGPTNRSGQFSEFENQTTSEDFSTVFNRSFSGSDGSAGAAARIHANPETGELKLFAGGTSQTDAERGSSARASSTAFAEFTIFETFRAIGNGTVTFNVDFDGFLDSSLQGGSPFFVQNDVLSNLTLRNLRNNRNQIDRFGTSLSGGALGLGRNEIDTVTTLSLGVMDGEEFDFVYKARVAASTNLFGAEVAADSLAAFDNTFNISFATTGGLQLSSDSNFLSAVGTDPVPAVPVPASLPLLLAGIGGFAALRRWSREA